MGTAAKRPRSAAEPTHFMNVDLDLEGRAAEIDALAVELDRHPLVLHRDTRGSRISAHYELRPHASTPDQVLRGLCRALERKGQAKQISHRGEVGVGRAGDFGARERSWGPRGSRSRPVGAWSQASS